MPVLLLLLEATPSSVAMEGVDVACDEDEPEDEPEEVTADDMSMFADNELPSGGPVLPQLVEADGVDPGGTGLGAAVSGFTKAGRSIVGDEPGDEEDEEPAELVDEAAEEEDTAGVPAVLADRELPSGGPVFPPTDGVDPAGTELGAAVLGFTKAGRSIAGSFLEGGGTELVRLAIEPLFAFVSVVVEVVAVVFEPDDDDEEEEEESDVDVVDAELLGSTMDEDSSRATP